jgi:hypothetical protein
VEVIKSKPATKSYRKNFDRIFKPCERQKELIKYICKDRKVIVIYKGR